MLSPIRRLVRRLATRLATPLAALLLLTSLAPPVAAGHYPGPGHTPSAGPGAADQPSSAFAAAKAVPDAGRPVVAAAALIPIVCDTSWTAGDGNWLTGANWSAGVPDATKNACLPGPGPYTVSILGNSVVALTLSIDAGVTLALEDRNCNGGGDAVLSMSGDLTNNGTLGLRNSIDGCGGVIHVSLPSGATLTNNGTIDGNGSNRGLREISGSVTNNGTFNVSMNGAFDSVPVFQLDPSDADALFLNQGTVNVNSGNNERLQVEPGSGGVYEFRNGSGGSVNTSGARYSGGDPANSMVVYGGGNTFTAAAGTTSGNPVVLWGDADTLNFTGAGASAFILYGSNTISGTDIAAGQAVSLNQRSSRSSIATLAGSLDNAGVIDLSNEDNSPNSTSQLVVPVDSILTNHGTIQTLGCCRGGREISGNVTNYGTVEVSHSASFPDPAPLTLDPGTFDNHGAIVVDDGLRQLSVVGETLIAELDGSITLGAQSRYAQDGASTLSVFIDARPGHGTHSGIVGGTVGDYTCPCLSLAGTLKVTTLGVAARGSSWPIINGATAGSFGATDFDLPYTVAYGSVTLTAAAFDATGSTPSSSGSGVTALPGGGVATGTTVYDAATVTGNDPATSPSGTVDFFVCDPAILLLNSASICTSAYGTDLGTPTLPAGSGSPVTAFSDGQVVDSPGTWCFAAYYVGDGTFPASSDAGASECFTVFAPVTTATTTTLYNAANQDVTGSTVPYGSIVHDIAVVSTGLGGPDIPAGSTITFTGFHSAGCTGDSFTPPPFTISGTSPASVGTGDIGPLTAGGYALLATFTSGDPSVAGSTASCESFTVAPAATTTATTLYNAANADVTASTVPYGTVLHDTATVSSGPGGPDIAAGSSVTFSRFGNLACSGTPSASSALPISGPSPASATLTPISGLAAGGYSIRAVFASGDTSQVAGSSAPCESFTVAPQSTATALLTQGDCAFDLDPNLAGRQFRLVFTPASPAGSPYRLSASNPGEFFYVLTLTGTPGTVEHVHIRLPYPFATKGATPTQVNDAFDARAHDGQPCADPEGQKIASSSTRITLANFGATFGSIASLAVNFTLDRTGVALIRVHLDYGLKGRTGYSQAGNSDASGAPTIINGQAYVFSDDAGGSASVASFNVFKRTARLCGLVLSAASGDPGAGVAVTIYDSSGHLVITTITDADGWYGAAVPAGNKALTYVVRLPAYAMKVSASVKSSQLTLANLVIP